MQIIQKNRKKIWNEALHFLVENYIIFSHISYKLAISYSFRQILRKLPMDSL